MKKLNILGLIIILVACEGEQGEIGPTGSNSRINITNELSGPNCSSGGFKIDVGIDTNNNGTLDVEETQSTKYVCNGDGGSDGKNSLVNVTDEPYGANCSSGGFKTDVGIDTNNNGTLDVEEIQSTQYVCNGGFDKEIRFDFDWPFFGSLGTSSASGEFNDIKTTIIDFNINNYLDVDSVAFGAFMSTSNVSAKCIVELYNKTDDEVIASGEVSTNSTSQVFVATTTNFLPGFPNKTFDLGIRVRTETEGVSVTLDKPLLFLFRNE